MANLPLNLLLIDLTPQPDQVIQTLLADIDTDENAGFHLKIKLITCLDQAAVCCTAFHPHLIVVVIDDFLDRLSPALQAQALALKSRSTPTMVVISRQTALGPQHLIYPHGPQSFLPTSLDQTDWLAVLNSLAQPDPNPNPKGTGVDDLQASEARLRKIIEKNVDGVIVLDQEGTVCFANPAAEAIFDRHAQDLIGQPFGFPIVTGETAQLDILHKNSQVIVAEMQVVETEWEGQTAYLASLHDITDHVLAKEALRKSEARYHSLVENAPVGILSVNLTGQIIDINPVALRILDISSDEAAQQINLLNHPNFIRSGVAAAMQETFTSEVPLIFECDYMTMGSLTRLLRFHLTPNQEATQHLVGILAVVEDVTEREQTRQALEASEIRYRRFFEEDIAGAFIARADGRLVACNAAFAGIFGFKSVKAALQTNLWSLMPDEPSKETFYELLTKAKKLEYHEAELRGSDGKALHVTANVIGGFNKQGNLVEIKGYLFDNTERKALEEQLRQSQKMEALGRLAGGIAHDFNNLLTVITGYTSLLLEQVGSDELLKQDIEEIKKASARATTLTHQLLIFSRKQMFQPRIIDVNEMVVTTKTMLRRLIGEDIDLVTNLQEPIAKIKTDPGQLEQIIMNLAINARDAMPQGGRLTIETANVRLSEIFTRRHPDLKPGAYVRLIVSDTGIGMDQMIMSHLFEPFFTTKEAGKGTGLGLATVHGIVKQNNGHITVHSEPGRGSSFKLYFPQVKESILVEETNEGRPRKYQGTETLLIVEDEAIVRELAHRILSQRGYHVIAAGNGQEALQICRNYDEPIDLMITDVVMPGMSGRDLAEQAAPIRPDMKILFISGYPNDIIAEHGILSDGISFLQKPFSPDSLTAKVQGILDRPAKIQMPPPNEGVLHLYRNGH